MSHYDGLILSAHCIFLRRCFGWFAFGRDMKRRLHYEKKKDMHNYIERFYFSSEIGIRWCFLGTTGWAKISLNTFCLSLNGQRARCRCAACMMSAGGVVGGVGP